MGIHDFGNSSLPCSCLCVIKNDGISRDLAYKKTLALVICVFSLIKEKLLAPCFFHFGSFSVDSRISRGGSNPYSHIWILTLKRIYAEGLQQIMLKICS